MAIAETRTKGYTSLFVFAVRAVRRPAGYSRCVSPNPHFDALYSRVVVVLFKNKKGENRRQNKGDAPYANATPRALPFVPSDLRTPAWRYPHEYRQTRNKTQIAIY